MDQALKLPLPNGNYFITATKEGAASALPNDAVSKELTKLIGEWASQAILTPTKMIEQMTLLQKVGNDSLELIKTISSRFQSFIQVTQKENREYVSFMGDKVTDLIRDITQHLSNIQDRPYTQEADGTSPEVDVLNDILKMLDKSHGTLERIWDVLDLSLKAQLDEWDWLQDIRIKDEENRKQNEGELQEALLESLRRRNGAGGGSSISVIDELMDDKKEEGNGILSILGNLGAGLLAGIIAKTGIGAILGGLGVAAKAATRAIGALGIAALALPLIWDLLKQRDPTKPPLENIRPTDVLGGIVGGIAGSLVGHPVIGAALGSALTAYLGDTYVGNEGMDLLNENLMHGVWDQWGGEDAAVTFGDLGELISNIGQTGIDIVSSLNHPVDVVAPLAGAFAVAPTAADFASPEEIYHGTIDNIPRPGITPSMFPPLGLKNIPQFSPTPSMFPPIDLPYTPPMSSSDIVRGVQENLNAQAISPQLMMTSGESSWLTKIFETINTGKQFLDILGLVRQVVSDIHEAVMRIPSQDYFDRLFDDNAPSGHEFDARFGGTPQERMDNIFVPLQGFKPATKVMSEILKSDIANRAKGNNVRPTIVSAPTVNNVSAGGGGGGAGAVYLAPMRGTPFSRRYNEVWGK